MKTMIHILLVFFFWLPYCMQPLMSQQTGITPGRPEDFKPFIYKHTTEELKKFTKKHIQMAEKAVEEMDEVIFNGPYKASFGSLTTHPTPD